MARKDTPETIDKIITALNDRATQQQAADAGEVSRATLKIWLKKGETAEPNSDLHRLWIAWQMTRNVLLDKVLKPDPEIKEIYDTKGQLLRTEKIKRVRSERANLWLLSKRFPQEFGGDKHLVVVPSGVEYDWTEADRIIWQDIDRADKMRASGMTEDEIIADCISTSDTATGTNPSERITDDSLNTSPDARSGELVSGEELAAFREWRRQQTKEED